MRRGKVCLGVFFIIGAMIYMIIAVMEEAVRAPMIVLAVLFLLFSFLLLRKKKEKPAPEVWMTTETTTPFVTIQSELTQPNVPADVLKQMRKTYTKANAIRDAQIMRESFLLCQQTCDFEVFSMRCTLAQRMAYTLLQAERAKCRGVAKLNTRKAAEGVLQESAALKVDFLDRAMEKAVDDALALKTPRGQRNRLQKLLNILQANEAIFAEIEDEYNAAVEQVKEQLAEIEKAGEV